MKRELPEWVRPIFGPYSCSICDDPEVFYMKPASWVEKEWLYDKYIEIDCHAMKCWCKDCYEDCGGKL